MDKVKPSGPFSKDISRLKTRLSGIRSANPGSNSDENKDRTQLPVLYTVQEVALKLSTSEKTIRRAVRDGHLRAQRIGRKVLFVVEEVYAFLDRQNHKN